MSFNFEHPNDKFVSFDSKTHKYHYYRLCDKFKKKVEISQSNTELLSEWFPFEEQEVAMKVSKNPNSKYFNVQPDKILKMWKYQRDIGTYVHKMFERSNKNYETSEFYGKFTEKEKSQFNTHIIQREKYCKYMESRGYIPFASEWVIFNPYIDIASSIDNPWIHKDTISSNKKKLIITDYKVTKTRLPEFVNFNNDNVKKGDDLLRCGWFKKGSYKGALFGLPTNSRNYGEVKLLRYSLQLGIIQHILESHYRTPCFDFEIVEHHVLRVHENVKENFELRIIHPNMYRFRIRKMFELRN